MTQKGWMAALCSLSVVGLSVGNAEPAVARPVAASPVATVPATPALQALGAISDTAANRQEIVVNDLAAVWESAGLPATPSVAEASTTAVTAATTILVGASPVGSQAWSEVGKYPAPFGYPALAVGSELVVGPVSSQLSEVWAPATPSSLRSAVAALNPTVGLARGTETFDFGLSTPLRPAPYNELLMGTKYLAVPTSGGRLAAGGPLASKAAVAGLAAGTPQPHSLAADSGVQRILSLWPADPITMTLGTTWITKPSNSMRHHLSARGYAALQAQSEIARLPAGPSLVGLAYVGGPTTSEQVIAVALYPSSADAAASVKHLGRYLRTGTSDLDNLPYARLWRVHSVSAEGAAAVARLTNLQEGAASQATEIDDFPLFWAP